MFNSASCIIAAIFAATVVLTGCSKKNAARDYMDNLRQNRAKPGPNSYRMADIPVGANGITPQDKILVLDMNKTTVAVTARASKKVPKDAIKRAILCRASTYAKRRGRKKFHIISITIAAGGPPTMPAVAYLVAYLAPMKTRKRHFTFAVFNCEHETKPIDRLPAMIR